MNNPFFKIWLSRLAASVNAGEIDAIENDIQEIGLEDLLDDEFFEYVQLSDSNQVAALLATLGSENHKNPDKFQRWQAAYHFLQGIISAEDAAKICAKNSKRKEAFYNSALKILKSENNLENADITKIPVEDLKFAIDLFVVAKKSAKIIPIVKYWTKLEATELPWLLSCRLILKRLEQKRQKSENLGLAKTLDLLLNMAPRGQEKVVDKIEFKLTELALLTNENKISSKYAKKIFERDSSEINQLLYARSLIQTGNFSSAIEQLEETLYKYAKNNQKKTAGAKSSGAFNPENAQDTLDFVTQLLAQKGIKPFLISGTLLGFEREGALLAHDKDLDLGVIGWQNQFAIAEALLASGVFEIDISKLKGHRSYLIYAQDLRNGTSVDFFLFHELADGYLHGIDFDDGFTLNYKFSKFELIERQYGQKRYWVPSNADVNLSENYGNWRQPEKNYVVTLESPAILDRNSESYKVCVYFELINSIRENGSANRVNRILSYLHENHIQVLKDDTLQAVKEWVKNRETPQATRLKEMLLKIRKDSGAPLKPSSATRKGPKILLIGHGFGADGAAFMLKKLARHWTQDLGWIVEAYQPDTAQHPEMEEYGIIPLSRLSNIDHQLVIFNTLLVADQASSIPAHIPKMLWVHEGRTLLENRAWSQSVWTHLFKPFEAIVFQTQWQARTLFGDYIKNKREGQIHIISNAVDFPGETAEKGVAYIKKESVKITSVASLTGRKRPHDLAEATLGIASSKSISCEFIGDMSRLETLPASFQKTVANGHPRLTFSGVLSQNEIAQKFQETDIFCLPSGDESYPLAPLEAALAGLPIVLADLPPYAEIGWQHEVNCLIYPAGKTSELRNQLQKLSDDPSLRSRLGLAAQAFAKTMTVEKFNQKISACALSLVKEKTAS